MPERLKIYEYGQDEGYRLRIPHGLRLGVIKLHIVALDKKLVLNQHC